MNKLHYLNDIVSNNEIDVLSVTETWLTGTCNSSFVELPGYEFYRGDVRGTVRKHGAGLYVSRELARVQLDVELPNLVVVHLPDLEVYLVSVYRPPSYSEDENQLLIGFLMEFSSAHELFILGDFNLPSLNWSIEGGNTVGVSPVDRLFRDCFFECGLTQWVEFGTFFPSGNTLDLILSSEDDRVMEVHSLPPLPGCHHCPVLARVVFQFFSDPTTQDEAKFNWRRGDYGQISEEVFDVDWSLLFEGWDVDSCFGALVDFLCGSISRHVPRKSPYHGGNWLVSPPRRIRLERSELWNRYKAIRSQLGRSHTVTTLALEQYKAANSNYKNFARNKQCAYELKLAGLLTVAPRIFHSYLRERKKGCPTVGPLRAETGILVTDQGAMSSMFVEAFSSVFVSSTPSAPSEHQTSDSLMEDLTVTYETVHRVLSALDVSSSPGPDGIHPMLLKRCADVLALPLSIIFGRSLSSGTLPQLWKVSRVSPIFKGGSRSVPLNYRPISLTSTCCKAMERIVSEHIVNYLEQNELLSGRQFGFRQGRSAEDQLLLTYGNVVRLVDRGRVVDVVYMDYSKAFDVVNHAVLLQKLRALGFSSQIVSWTEEFLTNRTLFVTVGGQDSESKPVLSGVPQGSVLGPLLFLIYANYLASNLSCNWYAYADDFKLYCTLPLENQGSSSRHLQDDLDEISRVSTSWNLRLNPQKCAVIRFGPGSRRILDPNHSGYFLNGVELLAVESHRDLGVLVDSSLKFHVHINAIVGKASALANQILRGTVCRDMDFMVTLFISHIRPILDYASSVWSVGYVGDLVKLESVQRRWTREVKDMSRLAYGRRLKLLHLFSIRGRMQRSDLIKVWKAFNAEVDVGLAGLLERNFHESTRGHNLKLSNPLCRGDARRRFWSVRCVAVWNELPQDIVQSETVEAFKRKLDAFMGDRFYLTAVP